MVFATHDGYEIYDERGFNSYVRREDHEIQISNSNDLALEEVVVLTAHPAETIPEAETECQAVVADTSSAKKVFISHYVVF